MAKQLVMNTYNNSYASHHIPNTTNTDEGKGGTTNEVYLLYNMICMYAELYMIVAIVRQFV
jgi:hypothetical protein